VSHHPRRHARPRTRTRTRTTVAAIAAALVSPLLTQAAANAEPSVDEVRARVDRLYHQAEIASERYNDIRTRRHRSRHHLAVLRRDLRRQRHETDEARQEVAAAVVARYQSDAFSATTQVLLSPDPDAFLERLSTVSAHDRQQSELMRTYLLEARKVQLRERATERRLAAIARDTRRLAAQKRRIEAKADRADELLATLEAEQRAAMARQQAPDPAQVAGGAKAAVDYALGQVGKPYVWAADGPGSYDCSGLTMMAWAQAGVSLPHSSSGQMSAGTPVSHSDLRPGDLVFYYSPVSHVGIYIGNGQIVDAANPSTGVRVTSVDSLPYSGAVRPG
jgi:cell wall-associated NlpC family hydrolase